MVVLHAVSLSSKRSVLLSLLPVELNTVVPTSFCLTAKLLEAADGELRANDFVCKMQSYTSMMTSNACISAVDATVATYGLASDTMPRGKCCQRVAAKLKQEISSIASGHALPLIRRSIRGIERGEHQTLTALEGTHRTPVSRAASRTKMLTNVVIRATSYVLSLLVSAYRLALFTRSKGGICSHYRKARSAVHEMRAAETASGIDATKGA
ncbi:hypothetical protein EJ05DRAFT_525528 [Pseudovirgaria hyperparasitica]|uniref:Uncharacterized protein n=1 Tax=Pseudovirgaria hyperparasitica TaxID=470096 RepID=A0A6A6WC43_9PEZI|nr:uncharacterized protein EJ05DRAFT_525528 [Pseudovirgaria hyperparasitica]KAF2760408.1 hypothetical protein EJ05DRAFT_525528 [Pseudovirgaria hyperparasitica]